MKKIIMLSFFLSFSILALDIRYNGKMYNNVDVCGVTENKIIIMTEDGFKLEFPREIRKSTAAKQEGVNITSLEDIEKFFLNNRTSALKKDQDIQKYMWNKITINGFRINGEPVIDPNSGLYVFMVQDTQNRCRIKIWAEGDDSKFTDLKQNSLVSFSGIIKEMTVDDAAETGLKDAGNTFDLDISLHLKKVKILNVF